jgi:hypothetical protein
MQNRFSKVIFLERATSDQRIPGSQMHDDAKGLTNANPVSSKVASAGSWTRDCAAGAGAAERRTPNAKRSLARRREELAVFLVELMQEQLGDSIESRKDIPSRAGDGFKTLGPSFSVV